MSTAKNFIKYIRGENLRQLERAGVAQQRRVRDFPYFSKNYLDPEGYKRQVDNLKDLDTEYSRQKMNLGLARTGLALPVVYGGAKFLEKNAASRLLQLLKGTRAKELSTEIKSLTSTIGKNSKNKIFRATSKKQKQQVNKLDSLKKERFKERALTWGSRGAAVSIPAVLAKNVFKKEAALVPSAFSNKEVLGLTGMLAAAGGTVGATRVLTDKETENSASNIATSVGVGALVGGAPVLVTNYGYLRNPKIKKLIESRSLWKPK